MFFLTNFMLLLFFYTPWKHKKPRGFLMFSGGIERDQWHEMGSSRDKFLKIKTISWNSSEYTTNLWIES